MAVERSCIGKLFLAANTPAFLGLPILREHFVIRTFVPKPPA